MGLKGGKQIAKCQYLTAFLRGSGFHKSTHKDDTNQADEYAQYGNGWKQSKNEWRRQGHAQP